MRRGRTSFMSGQPPFTTSSMSTPLIRSINLPRSRQKMCRDRTAHISYFRKLSSILARSPRRSSDRPLTCWIYLALMVVYRAFSLRWVPFFSFHCPATSASCNQFSGSISSRWRMTFSSNAPSTKVTQSTSTSLS